MSKLINLKKQDVKFIRAGAGAGKTTTLIQTCIDYVLNYHEKNKKYPKIVLTTFTNKATQEIKERLLLKAIALGNDELFQFLNKKSSVQIGTIHSLLNLYLRQNCEKIGFPVVLKFKDDYFFQKEIKKILKRNLETHSDLQVLLEQYNFIEIIQLVKKYKDLMLTNKKIEVLNINEIIQISKQKKENILRAIETFLTFHCVKVNDSWLPSIQYLELVKLKLLDLKNINDWEDLFSYKPARKFTWNKKSENYDEDINNEIAKVFSIDFLNELDFLNSQTEFSEFQDKMCQLLNLVTDDLMTLQKKEGYISISDIEGFSYQLYILFPESITQFSEQYDYFMIDEYQDTSPLQVELLNAMTKFKDHFIVGDPQQSIYLFRGARSEVFFQKEKEIKANDHFQLLEKSINYRSQPSLMNFINYFFNSFSKNFKSMIPKTLELNNEQNLNVFEGTFITCDNHEFLAILKQIDNLVNQGISFSDITILFKKNRDILDFQKWAQTVSLPVQVLVSQGYELKQEVRDLIIFLNFLICPFDNVNLIALLRMPYWNITDQQILELRQKDKDDLINQIENSNHELHFELMSYISKYQQHGSLETLMTFLNNKKIITTCFLQDSSTLRESNIWKFVQSLHEAQQKSEFRLADFISQFSNEISDDLVSSGGEAYPLIKLNRVNLMTIHGSKGLQFNHVIIPGFNSELRRQKSNSKLIFSENDKKFIIEYKFEDQESSSKNEWMQKISDDLFERTLAESERLLYVAMTRAIYSVTVLAEQKKEEPSKHSWKSKIDWQEPSFSSDKFKVKFIDFKFEEDISDLLNENNFSFNKYLNQEVASNADIVPIVIESEVKASKGVTHLLEEDESILNQSILDENKIVNQTEADIFSTKQTDKLNNLKFEENLKGLIFNNRSAKKGTELHQLFESLKYLNIEEVKSNLNEEENRSIDWLMNQTEIPLKEVLFNGYVEWGFGYNLGENIIQGQIDAWGVVGHKAYIIDYKTGSIKYLEKAFNQLEMYAQFLEKMNKLTISSTQKVKEIVLAVIYPHLEIVKTKCINVLELN